MGEVRQPEATASGSQLRSGLSLPHSFPSISLLVSIKGKQEAEEGEAGVGRGGEVEEGGPATLPAAREG